MMVQIVCLFVCFWWALLTQPSISPFGVEEGKFLAPIRVLKKKNLIWLHQILDVQLGSLASSQHVGSLVADQQHLVASCGI